MFKVLKKSQIKETKFIQGPQKEENKSISNKRRIFGESQKSVSHHLKFFRFFSVSLRVFIMGKFLNAVWSCLDVL
jgi:hypothetical protein